MRGRSPGPSSARSQFPDGRRRRGRHGRRHPLSVRVIELFANRSQLPVLELPDRDPAPPVGRPDDGRVHQLEHGALAEGVRDDLRPPPLLQEEPLQQVRRPDDLAMAEREPRWAMHASKSSRKHCTRAGSSRS